MSNTCLWVLRLNASIIVPDDNFMVSKPLNTEIKFIRLQSNRIIFSNFSEIVSDFNVSKKKY